MTVTVAERRRSPRAPPAYPVAVLDGRGHVLARGRTADISETGVLVVVAGRSLGDRGEVVLELSVPGLAEHHARRGVLRTIRYRCRVARAMPVGQLMGVGLEFVEKLA